MKYYLLYFCLLLSFSTLAQTTIRVHDKTHLKTKEVISKTTYPKADRFQIVYDYSVLPRGSYEARVSTNSFSETRAFSKRE